MDQIVLILGMHRSGTSCLTGCLEELGLNLGSVSTQNKYNKKGNRENKKIFQLNESVLNYSGGNWHSPPSQIKWTEDHKLEQQKLIDELFGLDDPKGFKDPRTLLTFPFWSSLDVSYKYVGTFRHPHLVATSLEAREKLSIPYQEGLELWYTYNKNLLFYQQKYQFKLLNFDDSKREYMNSLGPVVEAIGLNTKNLDKLEFFDNDLRHQLEVLKGVKLPVLVDELYKKLKIISKNEIK